MVIRKTRRHRDGGRPANRYIASEDITVLFRDAFHPGFIPARMPLLVPLSSSSFAKIVTDENLRANLYAAHSKAALPTAPAILRNQVKAQLHHFYALSNLCTSATYKPPNWYLPSKITPLNPHHAAVLFEIPIVRTQPLQIPSIVNQPCLHLFDDDLFLRATTQRTLRTEQPQAEVTAPMQVNGRKKPTLSTTSAKASVVIEPTHVLHFGIIGQGFIEAQFDPHDPLMALILLRLTVAGILSWHLVEEKSAIQLVLHDTWHKRSPPIQSNYVSFLRWLRNVAGKRVSGCEFSAQLSNSEATFTQQWTYNAVRRQSSDSDVEQWIHYTPRVDSMNELQVTLRPYQKRAVAWMLWRERSQPIPIFDDDITDDVQFISWRNARTLKPSCPLNVSQPNVNLVCEFSFHAPSEQIWFGAKAQEKRRSFQLGQGGLLCDEMGLGKTVELMQLVLCNKPHTSKISMLNSSLPVLRHLLSSFNHSLCPICMLPSTKSRAAKCPECNRKYHPSCRPDTAKYSASKFPCSLCLKKLNKLGHESTPHSSLPMSRATLIVVPTSLLQQWEQEVNNLARQTLTIFTFRGISLSGYAPLKVLLDADVVLTTYDALRKDIANVKALRRPRVGMRNERVVHPTPVTLLMIKWHRLAFDESQMLGASSNSQVFEMAKFIHAQHRWCVTGTPVTANDLIFSAPMFSIIGTLAPKDNTCLASSEEDALNHVQAEDLDWKRILRSSASQPVDGNWVRKVIRKFMWRTAKSDVDQTELDIPPQIVQIARINFGTIEKYHYGTLQRDIASLIPTLLNQNSESAVPLNLLSALRQACCHPRIGASGRTLLNKVSRRVGHVDRHTPSNGVLHGGRSASNSGLFNDVRDAEKDKIKLMTMDSVLQSIIDKARNDFQESLRGVIVAINGLAAFALIRYEISKDLSTRITNLVAAVSHYREALRTVSDVSNIIGDIDSIQRIHICFNLKYALEQVSNQKKDLSNLQEKGESNISLEALKGVGETIADANLMTEFDELRNKYLNVPQHRLRAVTVDLNKISDELGQEPLLGPGEGGDNLDDFDDGDDRSDDDDNCSDDDDDDDDDDDIDVHSVDGVEDNGNSVQEDGAINLDEESAERSIAKSKSRRRKSTWWELAMAEIVAAKEEDQFMERVRAIPRPDISGYSRMRFLDRATNFMMIGTVLQDEIREIQSVRVNLLDTLKNLPGARKPTEAEIIQSGTCWKCREGGNPKQSSCSHCQAEAIIINAEQKLYAVDDSIKTGDMALSTDFTTSKAKPKSKSKKRQLDDLVEQMERDSRRMSKKRGDGLRLQSELERFLILLGTTRRTRQFINRETNEAKKEREIRDVRKSKMYNKWMQKLEKIKREVVLAKSVLEEQRGLLGSMDEINMACTRISVVLPGQSISSLSLVEQRSCIKSSELIKKEAKQRKEHGELFKQLYDFRHRYVYLTNVQKRNQAKEGLADNAVLGSSASKRPRDESIDQCAICYSTYDEVGEVGILDCGHMFCRGCIEALMKKRNNFRNPRLAYPQCPTCRREVLKSKIIFTLSASKPPQKRQRINDLKEEKETGLTAVNTKKSQKSHIDVNGDDEIQPVRQNVDLRGPQSGNHIDIKDDNDIQPVREDMGSRKGGSQLNVDDNDEIRPVVREFNDSATILDDQLSADISEEGTITDEVASTFMDDGNGRADLVGAKSGAIVRLLQGIWKKEPDCKVVVFSAWTEVLNVIRWALHINNLQFIDGSDVSDSNKFGDVVASFRSNECTQTALLLPVQRAGAGLNLIEANHVITVEPWLDVALERQAVSRVHRIGQTKTTYVHRVIVNKTVEESILTLTEALRKQEQINSSLENNPLHVDWRDVLTGLENLVVRDVIDLTIKC